MEEATATPERDHDDDEPAEQELAGELLIEEISIDGMCGVY